MEETFDIDLLMKRTHPSTVVDVGAFSGNFTRDILEQSPECDCVMFEANPNCENNLEKVGVPYHITALSDSKREDVPFYIRNGYITCTGASLYKETTEEYKDAQIMKVSTSTLDEYELYPDGIDLLKCDVQGSELDVLKGAEETLKRTKNILLECSLIDYNENAPQIEEVIQYLKEKGFHANEIIGKHYNDDTVTQLDILFNGTVNKDVLKYISCQRDLKVEVISLKEREDRRKLFDAANKDKVGYSYFNSFDGKEMPYPKLKEMGFDCDHDWVDPILGTKLTKGEVGCYLSHHLLWLKCIEYDEPLLILEDDAVLTDRFSVPEIHAQLNNNNVNLLYLGWKEMGTSQPVNEQFVVPDYPYWGLAYVVTPEAAKILITNKTIIPVDEYLPKRLKDLRPLAYKENVVEAQGRDNTGSDTLLNSRYDAYLDFNVTALTVGTDESKCHHLIQSGLYNGINFINLGKGKNWEGGVMELGKGGGHKINLIREHLNTLPESDVVLFCDGYDVFINDNVEEFGYRYKEIGRKVIFGAEKICWPNQSNATLQEQLTTKQHPDLDTPYKYLNSGTFIGRVSELKRIFETPISNDDDDQLYCQNAYLSEQYDMCIDTDNYIFQCHEEDVIKQKGMLFNPKTKCYNLCYHGNGGFHAKTKFNQLYSDFYGLPSPIVYIPTHNYTKLKDNILLIDFLTPSMCDSIIELSERHGGYKNDVGDKVPGQEIRMKELNLLEGLSCHWERTVAPILDKEFLTCSYYGVRDAFIIKYTMDGQRELPLHSDASLVTGSIKLNDDYTGGELYYPRQELKNTDIPVGQCILFPGQVTHPHQSLELKSGTKWSLTIWTKRQWQD